MINEEITSQILGLAFRGTKMTSGMLKSALRNLLRGTGGMAKKIANLGKNSIQSYKDAGMEVSDIEITKDNIKDFDHVARKYGVKYSLKEIKDPEHPDAEPRWLVVFKAKDVNAMTKAFAEYTDFVLNKNKEKDDKQAEKDGKEEQQAGRNDKDAEKGDKDPEREGRESERENKDSRKNEKKKDDRNIDEKLRDAKTKAHERAGQNRERSRSQDRSSTIR